MKAKYTAKFCYIMDHHEFDRLMAWYTGQSAEFVAMEEANNDTIHEFDLSGTLTWSEYEQSDLDGITSGERYPYYRAGLILKALILAGHLPAGIWLIRVSW